MFHVELQINVNSFATVTTSHNPGAAYSGAEVAVRDLVRTFSLPVLPTPMGKGVVDDDDVHCVSSARTTALQHADTILLLGARLNWILHFGRPPRFDPHVKIIHVCQ